ncbi:N-6 DNA methylase [Streptomyces sp. NPDC047046]|uniref:N-6 DNA methylase n=1 Tax=Streptomyces sp. NPDC047046 TaxID=3155378 RepID=UPI0033EB3F43
MPESTHVTAAEISRIAGVTRATVSNWRRRHEDFPAPTGGGESSPLYELGAVRTWLRGRGHLPDLGPREELRSALRSVRKGTDRPASFLVFALAVALENEGARGRLADVLDAELPARASTMASLYAPLLPGIQDALSFTPDDLPVLRAVVRCVGAEGGPAAVSALAGRDLEETAASGVYGTPQPLADLAACLLPAGADRVLDPACGGGGLLAAAARRGATALFGQDVVLVQAQRTAAVLRLTAPDRRTTVRAGDSLRDDAFAATVVDAVLCNPPYGDRDWGQEELAYDPRWAYGVPGRSESELAWVQHCLAHLAPGGRAVLILPPATASRPAGRRVRAELVRSGVLRALVALPAGSAAPLHVGLHLWVLERPGPGHCEHDHVLFLNLAGAESTDAPERTRAGAPRTGASRAPLDWPAMTARTEAYWAAFQKFQALSGEGREFPGETGTAGALPILDLLDDIIDLTPARRLSTVKPRTDPAELSERAAAGRRRLTRATAALRGAGEVIGWSASSTAGRRWRTAMVSDLVRGGALTLLRTVPDYKRPGNEPVATAPPLFTAQDLAAGTGPTGDRAEFAGSFTPLIEVGDVLVRAVAGGTGPMARVAGEREAGAALGPQIHLLRPDPARLDSWFLAGFVGSAENIAGASTGSTVLHVAPGRLRVPLLPLDEQRRYGEAFQRVADLRERAGEVARLAEEAAALLSSGFTDGALLPGSRADEPA